jgi:serine/threonine-protein kinase Chk1
MSSSIPADVAQTLGVTVGQRLGSGAYKTVYLGVYTSTGEEVAVSAEPCGESQETESEAMFRITSEPPHPHIIGPPAGQATVPRLVAHGHVYTVQVRCQCELFDVLTDHGGCVPEQTMRGFFLQAVAGLRFMHQNGVAHRDIKLENMLLTHDGRLKLIDFGLAHVAPMPTPIHGDYAMTSSVKVGTRSYEAPEVGRGVPYDAALADVWSLACTFFALAAGFFIVDVAQTSDPRFRALSSAQSAGRSTVRAIFQLYNRPCPLSAPLVRLLDGMLMVDPTRRLTLDQVRTHTKPMRTCAPQTCTHPNALTYPNTRVVVVLAMHARNVLARRASRRPWQHTARAPAARPSARACERGMAV